MGLRRALNEADSHDERQSFTRNGYAPGRVASSRNRELFYPIITGIISRDDRSRINRYMRFVVRLERYVSVISDIRPSGDLGINIRLRK